MNDKTAKRLRREARQLSIGMPVRSIIELKGSRRKQKRTINVRQIYDGTVINGRWLTDIMPHKKGEPKFIKLVRHVPKVVEYVTAIGINDPRSERGVYRALKRRA